MNILILNWRDPKNPKSGGAEIVTQMHARAWVKSGHTVIWLSASFFGAKDNEIIDGVEIIRKGGDLTTYGFAPFFYQFSNHNFDIVIDGIHGLPYFTPLYVRKPKIAFIHEVAGEIWDSMYPFPVSTLGKMVENIYFHFYKNIFFWTVSDSTKSDLIKKGISPKKCIVISNPITAPVTRTLPKKEEYPTFIFISRLVKMKGIEDVIDAFSLIAKKKSNAKLWIVGGGEESYLKSLKKKTYDLGINESIEFLGKVTEKEKFDRIRSAHILLHASVKEGWGLVVIEAASQGTPSIVYNVNGLRDVVKNNKTGIILERNSPSEMAASSLKLLDDSSRYSMYQRNCLDWANSFSYEDAVKKSTKLLESVIYHEKK